MHKAFIIAAFLSFKLFTCNCQDTQSIELDSAGLSQFYQELEARMLFDSIEESFKYQKGEVFLGIDSFASIMIPQEYKYLDSNTTLYVLSHLWGNQPSPTLGMILPDSISPLSSNFTYAIDITYTPDGYIEDGEAQDLDYEIILDLMRVDAEKVNQIRASEGYPQIHLIGWATQPTYDSDSKIMHWAKEYQVEGDSLHTLNYNIRVLGRLGYLNLNIIGNMNVLPLVQTNLSELLENINFTNGYKYEEFNVDTDKMADYGLDGLILGKKIRKSNFLSKLFKSSNTLIFLGMIILLAIGKRFIKFGRKSSE